MQIILNKKDKEELVIQLYQEGKSMREVAQQVHLSFGTISKIIRRLNGLENSEAISNNMNNKSRETQALSLFLRGKHPIGLAIELDISSIDVENIFGIEQPTRTSMYISRN